MKKIILLGLAALTLAACADTRSHIISDSTQWEHNPYQVGKDTQELTEQQQEAAHFGAADRAQ